MLTKIIISILLVTTGSSNAERRQTIRFYTENDCISRVATGFKNYRDNTNVSGIPTATGYQSYCVVSGIWRVEYEWVQSQGDYNISIGDGCDSCYAKGSTGGKKFGYIEHLGGSDITKPSISFYTKDNFYGNKTNIVFNNNDYEYTFDQTISFQSVVFSSYNNFSWQIYQRPRYGGIRSCLIPMPGTEMTAIKETVINVGSLRLGCRNSSPAKYREAGFLATIIFAIAIPSIAVLL